jgi:hypothetical protein
MTAQEFRDRLAAARGADARDEAELFDELASDVCEALDQRNGSPPVVTEDEDADGN